MEVHGATSAIPGMLPVAAQPPARPRRPAATRALIAVLLLSGALNAVQYLAPQQSPIPTEDTVDRFHKLFYDSPATWRQSRWLGVPTLQNPNDVWVTQEIIAETKPDVIIETGTAFGGSALMWAMLVEHVNPNAKVITVDIEDPLDVARARTFWNSAALVEQIQAAQQRRVWRERVEFIKGSSTDPAIVASIRDRVRGRRALVILDSDHSKAHVLAELNAYAPMVNVGSYVIVQDTNVNGHPVVPEYGPGPMEAVDEFLATNKQFIADRSRERLLFTMHPKGYLKRVKAASATTAARG